jgi:Contractile injection system spike tip protein
MPADFVIRTGDMLSVSLAPPVVVPPLLAPVPLTGTGLTVNAVGLTVCLEGDELPPALRGPLPYVSPPFVTPGTGTLMLTLTPTNKTLQTVNGRAMLIKGTPFMAQFQVVAPAMQPTPGGPVPDPLLLKPGTAQFITVNVSVRAG